MSGSALDKVPALGELRVSLCRITSVLSDSLPLWTMDRQSPPSMGFSRQEYWNGLPFASPGDLPDPGIKPRSPALQADTLQFRLSHQRLESHRSREMLSLGIGRQSRVMVSRELFG